MAMQTVFEISQLNEAYAAVLDSGDWDQWPDFFLEDCEYKIQPRENFDRGLPLATLMLISQGMLKDRVYGIKETLFHDPYYQRHVCGMPRVLSDDGERIKAETSYAVFRTKRTGETTVFNVGRYLDEIVRTPEGLKFASRVCVFDTEMIPNSLIYPL